MKQKSILSTVSVVLVITLLLIVSQVATPAPVFAPPPPPPTLWVNNAVSASTDTSCANPGYTTISSAVAAASAGDIINVCTGLATGYVEQVFITISLTLTGVPYPTRHSAAPTIQAPATTLVPDTFGSLNIVTIGSGPGSGSGTFSPTVTFQGFTVTGPGSASQGCPLDVGIFVEGGATAYILQNTIEHIRENPIGGDQCGQGIFVGRHSEGTTGIATISGNTIFDYQKGGIVVDNTGSKATITHNTVTGDGPIYANDAPAMQNGIQISRDAVATVDSNMVSNNQVQVPCPYSGDGEPCGPDLINENQAVGILLYTSGSGTSVTNNAVSGNDIGIDAYQASTSTSTSTIVEHNTVINNRYAGIELNDETYAAPAASYNTVSGPGNVGIAAVADSLPTSVTLIGNTITGYSVLLISSSYPAPTQLCSSSPNLYSFLCATYPYPTASIGTFAGPTLTATIVST